MGYYYDFYVQQLQGDAWVVPEGFTNRDGHLADVGFFTWFKYAPLFDGDVAIFRLIGASPPDFESTALFQKISWGFDEWYRGWIPFREIMFDLWATSFVHIPTNVPADLASVFVGSPDFPDEELRSRGASSELIDRIRIDTPQNYLLEPIFPSDFHTGWVPVTYPISIAEFVGDWRVAEFQKLRTYGDDSKLRIVCTYS